MASEDDLKKLINDDYRTNFGTIGKEIDTFFHTEGLFENFLNGAKKALHSYTHAGMLQVGRRFIGTDLLPNYDEGEVIEVIRTTTSAIFMATNLVTKHFGFEDEWNRCTELFAEWGKSGDEKKAE